MEVYKKLTWEETRTVHRRRPEPGETTLRRVVSGIQNPSPNPRSKPHPQHFSKPCQPSECCFRPLDTEGRTGKRENGEGLKLA